MVRVPGRKLSVRVRDGYIAADDAIEQAQEALSRQ
jgi:hypothetical protein